MPLLLCSGFPRLFLILGVATPDKCCWFVIASLCALAGWLWFAFLRKFLLVCGMLAFMCGFDCIYDDQATRILQGWFTFFGAHLGVSGLRPPSFLVVSKF